VRHSSIESLDIDNILLETTTDFDKARPARQVRRDRSLANPVTPDSKHAIESMQQQFVVDRVERRLKLQQAETRQYS